jgi:hypothetical protein
MQSIPVSSKEEEVSLIMQCDYLPSLKFRDLGEKCLEHSSDKMTEAGNEAIKNELGVVRARSCMSLE